MQTGVVLPTSPDTPHEAFAAAAAVVAAARAAGAGPGSVAAPARS
jgi:hypothetical protein